MIANKTISSIGFEKYSTAVEIAFVNRETYFLNLTICQKRKGQLELVAQFYNIEWTDLCKMLKKTGAFVLLITGKPVIHKKVARFYENSVEVIPALLPDAKAGDFVAQGWEYAGQFYGSIMRMESFEMLLTLFNKAKLFPSNIYLGPYMALLFPTLLEKDALHFCTTNTSFNIQDNKPIEIVGVENTTKEEWTLGKDTLNHYTIPGLCANFNQQVNLIQTSFPQSAQTTHALSEHRHQKRFKTVLYSCVALLSVLVTTNYVYNQHLSKKHNYLEEELAINRQALAQIQKLESEIGEKKSLVGKGRAANGPVIGYLADELGASVPADIRLTNMEIFPLSHKIQKDKPVFFSYTKITVEGITNLSETLDTWMKTCKGLKWVKDIALIKYVFDNEQKKGYFKIEFLL